MSTRKDDKYTREEEDSSQVRSIINLLNGEKPSTERSREVVVRADGTKVVRVTKKRRVMVTKADKSRRARKNLLFSIIFVLLLTFSFVAYGVYNYAHMVSDSYLEEKQEQMRAAWGAESVKITGVKNGIGTGLEIESVLVTFPANCVIESVLLENLSAEVALGSYYTGTFQSEFLNIGRAHVQLREAAENLVFPGGNSDADLWDFKNVHCDKFSLAIGDSPVPSLNIVDSTVDMHAVAAEAYSFKLSGGKMLFAGMMKDSKMELALQDGFLTVTPNALRNMRINCKSIGKQVKRVGERDDDNMADAFSLSFCGDINKNNVYGPYDVNFTRASLKTLTGGLFENILSGDVKPLSKEMGGRLQLQLNPAVITGVLLMEGSPEFKTSNTLLKAKEICLEKTIEPQDLRQKYSTLNQQDFRVELAFAADELKLILPREDNGNEVSGVLKSSGFAEETNIKKMPVSGELVYVFPAADLCYKYKDKAIDPIYEKLGDNSGYYQFVSTIHGTCEEPADNAQSLFEAKNAERSALALNDNAEQDYRKNKFENQSSIDKEFGVKEKEDKDAIFRKPSEDDIFTKPTSSTPIIPDSWTQPSSESGNNWDVPATSGEQLNPTGMPELLPSGDAGSVPANLLP